VISDAHEGIKAAVARVLHASWQRCRFHFMRNVLAHAGRQGRRLLRPLSAPPSCEAASKQWRAVADQLRPKVPKLAALMDEGDRQRDAGAVIGRTETGDQIQCDETVHG
jgi:putative transposase